MKNLTILVVLISLSVQSQVDRHPFNDYEAVSFQVDPLGSIDKQGLNSVLSWVYIKEQYIPHLEWEVQLQTVINSQDSKSVQLDYIDLTLGFGVNQQFSNNVSIIAGIHVGGVYRPQNEIYDYMRGGFMFGPTLKGRLLLSFINDRISLIISSAYDYRADIDNWVINGRGGLEYKFN